MVLAVRGMDTAGTFSGNFCYFLFFSAHQTISSHFWLEIYPKSLSC